MMDHYNGYSFGIGEVLQSFEGRIVELINVAVSGGGGADSGQGINHDEPRVRVSLDPLNKEVKSSVS